MAHLYPDVMDLYGDGGNVQCLKRRCEWRDIEVDVVEVHVGRQADLTGVDLLVMGGGQDSAQALVAPDLRDRADDIRALVDEGAAALVVCGGFQLFGREYETVHGERISGIGVFDAVTVAHSERLVGNVSVQAGPKLWKQESQPARIDLVGFENHAGRTHLGPEAQPLGVVMRGKGNVGDGPGSAEGAVYRNAIGTYLHGPLLPRNPALADHLLVAALNHHYGGEQHLSQLDDSVELSAWDAAGVRADAATR